MDDPKLLALLEKYIEGTLDDAGRAELEKWIVSSLAARTTFWEYLEQHAFIGELGGEAKGRALARLEKPPTRRTAAPRRHRPSSGTLPFLIAAGLLIGFVVILVASMSGSDADEARSLAAFRAKQAERRKAAETRLKEIEQERQRILARPVAPEGKPEPQKEEERKKALQALAERQRKVDEELRQAIEEKPPTVIVEKTPEPPKPLVVPEKAPTVVAPAAVARIAKVEGSVLVDQKPAEAGQELTVGQRLETGSGSIELLYGDGTRVSFAAGSTAREFKVDGGKRFWMEGGSMLAVVAKQPKGQPMVVESKHGEATVVGTTLRIRIDPEAAKGMRLDVEEGTVQLKNRLSGKTVLVESGHYAVAASGGEMKSLLLPIDEILLTAAQAKITGGEWRLMKSPDLPGGTALESAPVCRRAAEAPQLTSFVTFTFEAEANRDYFVWMRGACVGTGADRGLQDGILVRFMRAQTTQPKLAAEWGQLPGDAVGLAGWGRWPGTRWIAGDGDIFDPTGIRVETSKGTGRAGDEMAATVRFTRSGIQTLRMYVLEGPMRIDAVWLSTTQKTRPDAAQVGPVK